MVSGARKISAERSRHKGLNVLHLPAVNNRCRDAVRQASHQLQTQATFAGAVRDGANCRATNAA